MAPLEPWEKVFVNRQSFSATRHGDIQCTFCHGGTQSSDMETAHTGMIADPSIGPNNVCTTCHKDQAKHFDQSLHASLGGYWTTLNVRSGTENHPALQTMFGNHCARCHTSCGDCHISQPASVGGGFVDGHVINKTPSMTRNCTACHGSRVGNEYLGKNEDLPGDVHFRQGRMNCVACHTGADMHGEDYGDTPPSNRYDGAQMPACTDCHTEALSLESQNVMHLAHGEKLSCQVCHAITYTSCDGCHVAISDKTGNPFFETQATYFTFFIGQNALKNENRPYNYVPVRHIPIAPTSYQFYGENLLPNFNALPTWAYATPHNIQRKAPQASACENCHASAQYFLTADKVKPEERAANAAVIVTNLPPSMDEINNAKPMPAGHANYKPGMCASCHANLPASHAGRIESACIVCHRLP